MSDNYAISLKRSTALVAAITFLLLLVLGNFTSIFSAKVGAAQFEERSLTLNSSLPGTEAVGSAGDPTNGASTTHTFKFKVPSTTALQAIRFEYCTTAIGTCTAPTNLDVDTPTIVTQTINGGAWPSNNWATGTSTANRINLTNTTTTPASSGHEAVFAFSGLRNPDDLGPFFVRITTYSDSFTTVVDEGTVASAITEGIEITSRVAETLGFSTTGSFAGVGDPGSNCAALTGSGAITLGDPVEQTLSITAAYDNYSAFRLYTNAANGVNVQYEGDTLRRTASSEIQEIDGVVNSGTVNSDVGKEQFGLGVDTAIGGTADVDSTSRENMNMTYVDDSTDFADANNGVLTIAAGYDAANGTITDGGTAEFLFAKDTPTTIASSNSFTNCKTAAVRYIANISPLTPAGTYRTTIVYSAVPTY